MNQKYKSLFKNIGVFTIGSFGSKLIAFLLVPLYTSILSTADYGGLDIVNSTVQLLTPILLLSINEALLRFGLDNQYNKIDVLSTAFNIVLKSSGILLCLIIIIKFIGFIPFSDSYLVFLYLSYVFGALSSCFSLYLKAKNNTVSIAISGILCTLLTCILNIIFLTVFKFGVIGYMIGHVGGVLAQTVYLFLAGKIYKEIRIKNYLNLSKPMLAYSIPLIANAIAWWINNASDRYILTWLSGVEANGIYSVSYKIPTILTTVQNIFYNAWSISAILEFDSKDKDGFIGKNYTNYSISMILACSILIMFNMPISTLLYKKDFFEAWRYVPFLLVATVLNGLSQFEGTIFAATKETKSASKTTIIGAVVNTLLNLILISVWGAIGAAIATVAGYLVTWIMRTIIVQRYIRMKTNWYNNIMALVFLIIQSILATYNKFIIIQILLFILTLVVYRKHIVELFKSTKKIFVKR